MTSEQNQVSEIGGASNSAPPSIVDTYVFRPVFPSNYFTTLRELSELYKKKELSKNDYLKLKLLAVLLVEQLLGQSSVDSNKVLLLMREYSNLKGGLSE